MPLSARIASHLPFLRRYARALTGSQTSGDAYVAATLFYQVAIFARHPGSSAVTIGLCLLASLAVIALMRRAGDRAVPPALTPQPA